MGDYSKLKNFLNENKSDSAASISLEDGFNSLKSNVIDFFSNKTDNNSVKVDLKEDQMDGWFKEAEKDKFCPTLVIFHLKIYLFLLNMIVLNQT
jgi:hypothetical protein